MIYEVRPGLAPARRLSTRLVSIPESRYGCLEPRSVILRQEVGCGACPCSKRGILSLRCCRRNVNRCKLTLLTTHIEAPIRLAPGRAEGGVLRAGLGEWGGGIQRQQRVGGGVEARSPSFDHHLTINLSTLGKVNSHRFTGP